MVALPRGLTVFTKRERDELFKRSAFLFRQRGLAFRVAPATKAYGRILIVVPKRVGTAVARNKLRRQIKSIFYEQKFYEHNKDLIVLVAPPAATLSFEEIIKLMTKVIHEGR
ncbi:ribonuclease P protein component [Candidatus Babeliales bacterium]|nr:ribonuclease P protein component [Candidatus Babeliales bacterium]